MQGWYSGAFPRGVGKSLANKALQTARPVKFLRVRNKDLFFERF